MPKGTVADLCSDGIGNAGAQALAAALYANRAQALAAALYANRTLKRLYLVSNGICNAGAEALAAALRDNGTLKELGLVGIGIGNEGAQALAAALYANRTLTSLDLGPEINRIPDAAKDALRAAARPDLNLIL